MIRPFSRILHWWELCITDCLFFYNKMTAVASSSGFLLDLDWNQIQKNTLENVTKTIGMKSLRSLTMQHSKIKFKGVDSWTQWKYELIQYLKSKIFENYLRCLSKRSYHKFMKFAAWCHKLWRVAENEIDYSFNIFS